MPSLRPALLVPWLAAAALLGGCSLAPAATEDDDDTFVHRAYTAWQPLPSKDGSRLAFALEPRRVDADSHGVMVTGWRGRVAGDGVVVAPSDGPPSVLTTVPRGFLDADGAESDLFVWTKAASEWTPVAPNDMPPPTPYASVTWLDRATFAVKGTRAFSPPLEMPIAVGGSWVLDTPRLGQSDFERDVHLALHDVATGAVQSAFEVIEGHRRVEVSVRGAALHCGASGRWRGRAEAGRRLILYLVGGLPGCGLFDVKLLGIEADRQVYGYFLGEKLGSFQGRCLHGSTPSRQ